MIHVDVYVPAMMKNYEFSLNEHSKISAIIEEIAHMISQKEQMAWKGNISELSLCNVSNGFLLPMEKSLYQCKTTSGSRLILI